MCFEQLQEGQKPVCVENCPAEAMLFGKRRDLIEIARQRIYENPDQYYNNIYGEHEAGGTCVLYLSSVPFEEIGFKAGIGSTPYPEYTKDFLYGVPVVLTLWPAMLLATSNATKKDDSITPAERNDHGTE